MDNKLIAAAAGLFGYGALVGWALTGDYFERKIKEKDQNIDVLRSKLREPRIEYTIEPAVMENVRLHSVSIDEQSSPFGGKIVTVDFAEDESVQAENPLEENSDGADVTGENEEDEEEWDEIETEIVRSNLQELIDSYTSNPDDVDTFVNTQSKRLKRDHTPPFVISREKYSWDEEEGDDYSKITLTYYPRDRVLLDDDEDVISDVDNMVGWRSLAQFGGESGDPDVVFVRNRRLHTDFEVVRDEENALPLHVKYGMSRDEFQVNSAAGVIKFRPEDM